MGAENNLLASNLNQVCVCVQTNILNVEFKREKLFVTKWKPFKEKKNHSGATKLRKSTIQKQS
jgi:hypothetical protein